MPKKDANFSCSETLSQAIWDSARLIFRGFTVIPDALISQIF